MDLIKSLINISPENGDENSGFLALLLNPLNNNLASRDNRITLENQCGQPCSIMPDIRHPND